MLMSQMNNHADEGMEGTHQVVTSLVEGDLDYLM